MDFLFLAQQMYVVVLGVVGGASDIVTALVELCRKQ